MAAAATFESAIPEHLRADRTVPARMPEGYAPPFPAFASHFPKKAADLVMAVIGAQYASQDDVDGVAREKLEAFAASKVENAPTYHDWASVTDPNGSYNLTMIAYWPSRDAYESWATGSGFKSWWEGIDPAAEEEEGGHGWFLEIFFPSVDRLETVFSHPGAPEGVAYLQESQAGPIKEHIYWGSMRDRLPVSQTDALEGTKDAPQSTTSSPSSPSSSSSNDNNKRIRVHGQKNLAVIRSGQDVSTTLPEELELYNADLAPVLKRGMDFLRDQGDDVGCHSCRFMDVVSPATLAADKKRTFGLAYFDDLASLEAWSREHPTHLAIFGGFMQYAQRLQGNISLRLFHEVLVLTPEQQYFEYVGCHPATGMLRTARAAAAAVASDDQEARQLEEQKTDAAAAAATAPVGLVASVAGKFRQLLQAVKPSFMTPTRLKPA